MGFRSDLQCNVTRLAYDFEVQVGTLNMAEGNYCDMGGCIALFRKIDAGVKRINTLVGSTPDVSYIFSDNEWRAVERAR